MVYRFRAIAYQCTAPASGRSRCAHAPATLVDVVLAQRFDLELPLQQRANRVAVEIGVCDAAFVAFDRCKARIVDPFPFDRSVRRESIRRSRRAGLRYSSRSAIARTRATRPPQRFREEDHAWRWRRRTVPSTPGNGVGEAAAASPIATTAKPAAAQGSVLRPLPAREIEDSAFGRGLQAFDKALQPMDEAQTPSAAFLERTKNAWRRRSAPGGNAARRSRRFRNDDRPARRSVGSVLLPQGRHAGLHERGFAISRHLTTVREEEREDRRRQPRFGRLAPALQDKSTRFRSLCLPIRSRSSIKALGVNARSTFLIDEDGPNRQNLAESERRRARRGGAWHRFPDAAHRWVEPGDAAARRGVQLVSAFRQVNARLALRYWQRRGCESCSLRSSIPRSMRSWSRTCTPIIFSISFRLRYGLKYGQRRRENAAARLASARRPPRARRASQGGFERRAGRFLRDHL